MNTKARASIVPMTMICILMEGTEHLQTMTLITGTRNRGFTLIEVMVTVVILALGTLMIQEGLLRAADLFGRHSNTVKVQRWVDEKIWQVRESFVYSDEVISDDQGQFTQNGKLFTWALVVKSLAGEDLKSLALSVAWKEGNRYVTMTKEMYAAKLSTDLSAL